MIQHFQRLLRRRQDYKQTFPVEGGQIVGPAKGVIEDLKRFARINEPPLRVSASTGVSDPMATGVAIGRQEVVNRILAHIHLPISQRFLAMEEDHE